MINPKMFLNFNILYIVGKEVNDEMFFMISWWIVLGIMLVLFLVSFSSSLDRRTRRKLNSIVGFLAIFQVLLLMVALAIKDPIFELIGLPKEYEWLGGLFLSGFLLWQFYLSPLKERVIDTEKDVREIKTDVKNIQKGIDKIDSKIK